MKYHVILTKEDLISAIEECRHSGIFSFDIETSPHGFYRGTFLKELTKSNPTLSKPSLSPQYSKICTISFCYKTTDVFVVPIHHIVGNNISMPEEDLWKLLDQEIFRNDDVLKIAYNLPFESKFLLAVNCMLSPNVADPMHLLIRYYQVEHPHSLKYPLYKGMGLKDKALELFGYQMQEFSEVTAGVSHFDETDIKDSAKYSGDDSIFSLLIFNWVKEKMEAIPVPSTVNGIQYGIRPYKNYYEVIKNVECTTLRVIGMMEYNGMRFTEDCSEIQKILEEKKAAALREIVAIGARHDIKLSPGSNGKTNSIKNILFEYLCAPILSYTEKGAPSIGKDELDLLIKYVDANLPVPPKPTIKPVTEVYKKMLESNYISLVEDEHALIRYGIDLDNGQVNYKYREDLLRLLKAIKKVQTFATMISSHLVGRSKYRNKEDGRIHSSYNLYPQTSRFASDSPNMQNVSKDKGDLSIRDLYIPEKNSLFLCIDYQAQEVRIGAEIYEDVTMRNNITCGIDMHSYSANTIFDLGFSQDDFVYSVIRADKEYRDPAKIGIFQRMYGGSAWSIRNVLRARGIYKTIKECQKITAGLDESFNGMKEWQKHIKKFLSENGYVETMLGYKRRLPEAFSSNNKLVGEAIRRAMNTPIQGSAAEVAKHGLNNIYNMLLSRKWSTDQVKIVATIHDENILEISKMPMETLATLVKDLKDCMEAPIMEGMVVRQIAEPEIADPHDIYNIGKSNGWGKKRDYYKWKQEVELHVTKENPRVCG